MLDMVGIFCLEDVIGHQPDAILSAVVVMGGYSTAGLRSKPGNPCIVAAIFGAATSATEHSGCDLKHARLLNICIE